GGGVGGGDTLQPRPFAGPPVHLGRAVLAPVIVSERLQAVSRKALRRLRVERPGERQVEAGPGELHVVDLEGHDAGVDEALQPVGAAADAAPAAVGLAGVEAAVGAEGQAVDAALEALADGEAGALVAAVDLLQGHAHDHRLGLVADEALAGEGAELAAGGVPDRLAGRLAHAAVGEPDARRRVRRGAALLAGALLAVVEHAAGVLLAQDA